jgi:uracil-DNA glycosylase family 4
MSSSCIKNISRCSACALCRHQKPLLDAPRSADVFWVGLSAVRVDDVSSTRPLASDTRSGKLIEAIELQLSHVSFYRSNLVKCLPSVKGKIRYPARDEMRSCFPNLVSEFSMVSPRVVLLLGKQVADYVYSQLCSHPANLAVDFSYSAYVARGVAYVPVHHPSFVLIYHRRRLDKYVNGLRRVITEHLTGGV